MPTQNRSARRKTVKEEPGKVKMKVSQMLSDELG